MAVSEPPYRLQCTLTRWSFLSLALLLELSCLPLTVHAQSLITSEPLSYCTEPLDHRSLSIHEIAMATADPGAIGDTGRVDVELFDRHDWGAINLQGYGLMVVQVRSDGTSTLLANKTIGLVCTNNERVYVVSGLPFSTEPASGTVYSLYHYSDTLQEMLVPSGPSFVPRDEDPAFTAGVLPPLPSHSSNVSLTYCYHGFYLLPASIGENNYLLHCREEIPEMYLAEVSLLTEKAFIELECFKCTQPHTPLNFTLAIFANSSLLSSSAISIDTSWTLPYFVVTVPGTNLSSLGMEADLVFGQNGAIVLFSNEFPAPVRLNSATSVADALQYTTVSEDGANITADEITLRKILDLKMVAPVGRDFIPTAGNRSLAFCLSHYLLIEGPTPGEPNDCAHASIDYNLYINEINSADDTKAWESRLRYRPRTGEYVELYHNGVMPDVSDRFDLSSYYLAFVDATTREIYRLVSLQSHFVESVNPYFVVGTRGGTTQADLVVPDNGGLLRNGPAAVILYFRPSNSDDIQVGQKATAVDYTDVVLYSDGAQPLTNGSALAQFQQEFYNKTVFVEDPFFRHGDESLSSCYDDELDEYVFKASHPTPGGDNDCGFLPEFPILINEVQAAGPMGGQIADLWVELVSYPGQNLTGVELQMLDGHERTRTQDPTRLFSWGHMFQPALSPVALTGRTDDKGLFVADKRLFRLQPFWSTDDVPFFSVKGVRLLYRGVVLDKLEWNYSKERVTGGTNVTNITITQQHLENKFTMTRCYWSPEEPFDYNFELAPASPYVHNPCLYGSPNWRSRGNVAISEVFVTPVWNATEAFIELWIPRPWPRERNLDGFVVVVWDRLYEDHVYHSLSLRGFTPNDNGMVVLNRTSFARDGWYPSEPLLPYEGGAVAVYFHYTFLFSRFETTLSSVAFTTDRVVDAVEYGSMDVPGTRDPGGPLGMHLFNRLSARGQMTNYKSKSICRGYAGRIRDIFAFNLAAPTPGLRNTNCRDPSPDDILVPADVALHQYIVIDTVNLEPNFSRSYIEIRSRDHLNIISNKRFAVLIYSRELRINYVIDIITPKFLAANSTHRLYLTGQPDTTVKSSSEYTTRTLVWKDVSVVVLCYINGQGPSYGPGDSLDVLDDVVMLDAVLRSFSEASKATIEEKFGRFTDILNVVGTRNYGLFTRCYGNKPMMSTSFAFPQVKYSASGSSAPVHSCAVPLLALRQFCFSRRSPFVRMAIANNANGKYDNIPTDNFKFRSYSGSEIFPGSYPERFSGDDLTVLYFNAWNLTNLTVSATMAINGGIVNMPLNFHVQNLPVSRRHNTKDFIVPMEFVSQEYENGNPGDFEAQWNITRAGTCVSLCRAPHYTYQLQPRRTYGIPKCGVISLFINEVNLSPSLDAFIELKGEIWQPLGNIRVYVVDEQYKRVGRELVLKGMMSAGYYLIAHPDSVYSSVDLSMPKDFMPMDKNRVYGIGLFEVSLESGKHILHDIYIYGDTSGAKEKQPDSALLQMVAGDLVVMKSTQPSLLLPSRASSRCFCSTQMVQSCFNWPTVSTPRRANSCPSGGLTHSSFSLCLGHGQDIISQSPNKHQQVWRFLLRSLFSSSSSNLPGLQQHGGLSKLCNCVFDLTNVTLVEYCSESSGDSVVKIVVKFATESAEMAANVTASVPVYLQSLKGLAGDLDQELLEALIPDCPGDCSAPEGATPSAQSGGPSGLSAGAVVGVVIVCLVVTVLATVSGVYTWRWARRKGYLSLSTVRMRRLSDEMSSSDINLGGEEED